MVNTSFRNQRFHYYELVHTALHSTEMHYITSRYIFLRYMHTAVADPDLELLGGGGGVVNLLALLAFSLLSFRLFLPKIRGNRPPPRSVTVLGLRCTTVILIILIILPGTALKLVCYALWCTAL